MDKILIEGKSIEYEIIKSNRKTIELSINTEKKIMLKIPNRCNREDALKFLKEKESWIKQRLEAIESHYSGRETREFTNGEKLLYIGKEYPLEVQMKNENKVAAGFDGSKFTLIMPSFLDEEKRKETSKEILLGLYRKIARNILQDRSNHYSRLVGVQVNKIFIKEQKTLWGSCSSLNNINYNWKLVMAPLEVLDYVVIHELCHIIHRNHSQQFWSEVEKHMPTYKKSMEWLKKHGRKLQLDYIYIE